MPNHQSDAELMIHQVFTLVSTAKQMKVKEDTIIDMVKASFQGYDSIMKAVEQPRKKAGIRVRP